MVTDKRFFLTFHRICLFFPISDINTMNCPDEKIIALVLSRDRGAENQAIECLKPCVQQAHGVLLRMQSRDDMERRSIVNLAVGEFIVQVRQGKFELTGVAKICTYVTEIAKRKWMEFSRRNKPLELDVSFMMNEMEPAQEDNDFLYAALQELEAADRDLLVAFYFYDMSLEDYATLHNISYDAVKKRISRARERLRKLLKPDEH
jgi:RNA polymerase sigma factor (sigma-70 family)